MVNDVVGNYFCHSGGSLTVDVVQAVASAKTHQSVTQCRRGLKPSGVIAS
tara:strand:- start:159 stop:308 length:150 start_codon:yes stop_codon:yes gene_type:complete